VTEPVPYRRTFARLLGFLQTPWKPTLEACRAHHEAAITQVAAARRLVSGPG